MKNLCSINCTDEMTKTYPITVSIQSFSVLPVIFNVSTHLDMFWLETVSFHSTQKYQQNIDCVVIADSLFLITVFYA